MQDSSTYKDLVQTAVETPLLFRSAARTTMAAFSVAARYEVAALTTNTVTAEQFYQQWSSILDQQDLIRRAPTVKTAVKSLERHLLLSDSEAESLLAQLSRQRVEELHSRTIARMYSSKQRRARSMALEVLRRDVPQTRQQSELYDLYRTYKTVAKQQAFTVYDQHDAFVSRLHQGMKEAAQIRSFKRSTKKRIRAINDEVTLIESQNDGLIASIFSLSINAITMRAAHQRYEKALAKLSDTDQHNPVKKLALYEKEVKALRSEYLHTTASDMTLRGIQQASRELDGVLLRIFDMDTRRYNELMAHLKQYRELVRERETLYVALQEK